MAHHAGTDLGQLELETGQRPVDHCLGRIEAAQECGQVVGQRMQLQPHLIIAKPLARQPCPVEGILAFLDVLLGGAALVVETHHPFKGKVICLDYAIWLAVVEYPEYFYRQHMTRRRSCQ